MDSWHEKVALTEMTHHEFMDEARTVEKTIFSGGQAIICNYGSDAVSIGGEVLEGMSFRIQT